MSAKANQALERFKAGYFCSQAVLSVFCEDLGMDALTALKVSSGFGGGVGRTGQICGAVSGACMALGLHDWHADPPTPEEKNRISERVRAFSLEFTRCHGSVVCKDLLGCDLGTPEGRREAADRGVFVSVCRPLVEDAARIVEKMLTQP
jgi:C_GCAxxG_C_C family probable redox protein